MEHGSNTDFTMIGANPCFIRGSNFLSSTEQIRPSFQERVFCHNYCSFRTPDSDRASSNSRTLCFSRRITRLRPA